MKKFIYLFIGALGMATAASAQVVPLMPNISFGIKGGVNLANFSTERTLSADNRVGYLAGAWSRINFGGLHFQPELYFNSRNVDFYESSTRTTNKAKFRSIDLPLLIGKRFGMLGVAARINTGPMVSFAVSHDQSVGDAYINPARLRVKDQNYAWQFGAGLDVYKLSFDARYEMGINKLENGNQSADVRLNMFTFAIGYRLFSL